MATPSDAVGGRPSRAVAWLARLFFATTAIGSIAWGIVCAPVFFDESNLDGAKELLLRNVPLSDAELEGLGPALVRSAKRSYCVPAIDRSAAIVRLRLAENAFTNGQSEIVDARMNTLDQAINKSLGCAPADPYLWLVLFWVRNNREGISEKNFDLLRMSYRLGPNEGWVASKRNHLALAMFDVLPSDIAKDAIAEFSRLVKSELYPEAVDLLKGPGWSHRDVLMAGLSSVPQRNINILAKAMADIGYDLDSRSPAERRAQDHR
jgi:hypothetical protein